MCLIIKWVKNSNTYYENEIHRVDSPFNEGSINIIFFQGDPNFVGEIARTFREMAKNREIHCYAN